MLDRRKLARDAAASSIGQHRAELDRRSAALNAAEAARRFKISDTEFQRLAALPKFPRPMIRYGIGPVWSQRELAAGFSPRPKWTMRG